MTDVPNARAAAAVHAEIICGRCPSPTPTPEAAVAAGPLLVVRLPVGGGEPIVRVAREGRAVVVEARDGALVWEHEIDLPFTVEAGAVTVHRHGASVELHVPVPVRTPVPA